MTFSDFTRDKQFLERLLRFKKKHGYATEADCLEAMVRLGMFFQTAPAGSIITKSASGMTAYSARMATGEAVTERPDGHEITF